MKKLVLAVIALGFSVGVNAACTRNDLTGNWTVYSAGNNSMTMRCELTFKSKGDEITTNCVDATLKYGESGIFKIVTFNPNCNFVASLTTDYGTTAVISTISKGKDSITGMWYNTANQASGSFNGSKQ